MTVFSLHFVSLTSKLYLELSHALLGTLNTFLLKACFITLTGACASSKHLVCQPVSNDRVPWYLRSLSKQ